MSKKAFQKNMYWILFLLVALCLVSWAPAGFAQPKTHKVVKGDTLWSICEKYYGDPNLWPTLWEMNPFVTNPHLLHPGDLITLFEKEPEKAGPSKPEPVALEQPQKPLPEGIDISVRTNPDGLGYLSLEKIGAWGTILASENGKKLQYKDDIVYLQFVDGVDVKEGDEFTIIRNPDKVTHPLIKKSPKFTINALNQPEDLGYVVRFEGRVKVEKFVGLGRKHNELYQKPQIYRARITHSYRSVNVGHKLIPYAPVSPCVKPIHLYKDILGNIVAAKEKAGVIGADSVVYIDKGFNQGIQRGHILQVVKAHVLPDPDVSRKYTSEDQPTIILPDIPKGLLMVVESRPDTSIAIVIRSEENIKLGYYVKTLYWDKIPRILQRLRRCDLE